MAKTTYRYKCTGGRITAVESRFTAQLHSLVQAASLGDTRKQAAWREIEESWSERKLLNRIRIMVRRIECRLVDEWQELKIPEDSREYQDSTVEMTVERKGEGTDKDRLVVLFEQDYHDWDTKNGRVTPMRRFQAILVVSTNVLTFGDLTLKKVEKNIP